MHAIGCAEELASKRKGWGGENLAKWAGVTTNAKGRVVELDLSGLKSANRARVAGDDPGATIPWNV